MAGSLGHPGRIEGEPNVLPMIDVLLVLLIIFILASIRHVLEVQVPPATAASPARAPSQIVLELLPDSGFAINGQPVPNDRLEATLEEIYRPRAVKLLFIKAAPHRKYQEVVDRNGPKQGRGRTSRRLDAPIALGRCGRSEPNDSLGCRGVRRQVSSIKATSLSW